MAACPHSETSVPSRRLDLRSGCGLRLAADCWGEGAPQVLYAHGFGQTRGAWSATAARLAARGYSGLSLDARGHGDSDWNAADTPYRMEQLIDDLAHCARAQPRPVLVGASMGGLLGIAAQHLHQVFSALILVDIAPRWDARGVQRILQFMGAFPAGFASLDEAAQAVQQYLPHRDKKTPDAMRAVLRPHPDGRWRWHWDPRLLNDIGHAGEQYQAALETAASGLSLPVLLISGGRSDLIGNDHVEHFQKLVPHAQHVRIAEATHMVAGDQNDQFTDAILAFLPTVTARVTAVLGVDA